jgi:hypothetical protein
MSDSSRFDPENPPPASVGLGPEKSRYEALYEAAEAMAKAIEAWQRARESGKFADQSEARYAAYEALAAYREETEE